MEKMLHIGGGEGGKSPKPTQNTEKKKFSKSTDFYTKQEWLIAIFNCCLPAQDRLPIRDFMD